jgi:hypothetical protein
MERWLKEVLRASSRFTTMLINCKANYITYCSFGNVAIGSVWPFVVRINIKLCLAFRFLRPNK